MDFSLLTLELSLRVAAGILFGAALGFERAWRSRMAGIRTNALVAGGSALFVVLGAFGFDGGNADPTRVAAQVVSGIGFLGAGVILRDGMNIRGLNTAATLWCAAAIGSLTGAGLYLLGAVGTVAVLGANTLLRPIGKMIRAKQARIGREDDTSDSLSYRFETRASDKSESRVRALMLQAFTRPELTLHSVRSSKVKKDSTVVVRADLTADRTFDDAAFERAVQRISLDPKVVSVRWWAEDDDND